jgi:hypothetical protein
MQCISGQVNQHGPIIPIGISAPSPNPAGEPSNVINYHALIDTGTSRTLILRAVAVAAGLECSGWTPLSSANSSSRTDLYLADLHIPFPNPLVIPRIELGQFGDPLNPFEILIGRDVICRGDFFMSHDGHFTLCL